MKKIVILKSPYKICYTVVLFSIFASFASGQNGKELVAEINGKTIWGAEINGLRVGVYISPGHFNKTEPDVFVDLANSFTTNNYTDYLKPPTGSYLEYYKPPARLPFYIEMRTPDGHLLIPKDKSFTNEAAFPKNIPREKLPQRDWSHTLVGELNLTTNKTVSLGTFNLGDVFMLETNRGNFNLTVWAKVYKFEPDYKSAKLIELPPVSTTISLP